MRGPRSLHYATAEGAVAAVGMTEGARRKRHGTAVGMTAGVVVAETGCVVKTAGLGKPKTQVKKRIWGTQSTKRGMTQDPGTDSVLGAAFDWGEEENW